jgi:hypothetical protein
VLDEVQGRSHNLTSAGQLLQVSGDLPALVDGVRPESGGQVGEGPGDLRDQ